MQRLEKQDSLTIRQEAGNTLNKNLAIGRKNSIAFKFWPNKNLGFYSEIICDYLFSEQET